MNKQARCYDCSTEKCCHKNAELGIKARDEEIKKAIDEELKHYHLDYKVFAIRLKKKLRIKDE